VESKTRIKHKNIYKCVNEENVLPKANQKSITLPEWVYILAKDEFERNKKYYKKLKITSVTRLISLWILNNSRSTNSDTSTQ